MPLGPGFRIGPYEIVASLGAGGMGEVYRARDARLKRDVALKFLPEAVAADPERLARFEREAQALAALKHPHIAAIHGIAESGGLRALVLELAEGETLADHIARGAIPISEALAIARQIVDAVEAAHEHGIVHRDLKPANIQIAPDGVVKVLDFGLARIAGSHDGGPTSGAQFDSSMSPTITSPALVTGQSVLMGTAAYMAPEQARGKPADKRADIWAFGVVLYEMLTGTRAFAGESVTEVAGAVIHKELNLSALPHDTPESVRLVLKRCLQKDPKQRIRDMGDVRLVLDGAFDTRGSDEPGTAAHSRSRLIAVASAAALVAALLAAGVMWMMARPAPIARNPVRVEVPTAATGFVERLAVALSPDGRRLAFIARDNSATASDEYRIWIYSFNDGQSRILAPAEPVRFAPFWSPDSQSLAFLGTGGKLKRVDLNGAVRALADFKSYSGGCWVSDDAIVVATVGGFVRVPASGGTPTQLTEVAAARGETYHAGAWPLPDGRHFLYVRASNDAANAGIYIGRVDARPQDQNLSRLMTGISLPVYARGRHDRNAHLVFVRDGSMMAQMFDTRRLELIGEAAQVPGVDSVHSAENIPAFSASSNGALAFRRGGSQRGSPVFVSRDGKDTGSIATDLERPEHPRISPDGRSLALVIARELWKYDLGGRPPVKLTFDGGLSPVWSHDGRRIVYEGGGTLRAVPSDGGGKPEPVAPTGHFHPHSLTPDSREVVAVQLGQMGESSFSLVRLALRADAKPDLITDGGFHAALSPDGQWLAYTAETTGAQEIWVRPYSGSGAPIRVSPGGGKEPVWAKNGRELYYLQDKMMMAVAVDTAAGFNFKPAVKLFETSHHQSMQPPSYDVTADGRFIMIKPDESLASPITVIFDWTEMLGSEASRVH